jgi:hypothetical protein
MDKQIKPRFNRKGEPKDPMAYAFKRMVFNALNAKSCREVDEILGFTKQHFTMVVGKHKAVSDEFILALHLASGIEISVIKEMIKLDGVRYTPSLGRWKPQAGLYPPNSYKVIRDGSI